MQRIIVVSTDPWLKRALDSASRESDLELEFFSDARAARDRLIAQPYASPHVVLIDLTELDAEFCTWLRGDHPAVQLVATARVGEHLQARPTADDFITRPMASPSAWVWRLGCAVRRARKKREELDLDRTIPTPSAGGTPRELDAIGQFARGVAHDFNNVLGVITGNASFLQMALESETPDVRDALADIVLAAKQASELAGRLFKLADAPGDTTGVTSLNRLVTEMARVLGSAAGSRVTIREVLAPSVSPVGVESEQMSRVLLNLVINARDAMPNGGTITIETATVVLGPVTADAHGLSEGLYSCLSVTDTGVGMSPATMARALEPLYTTKPPGEGTGIGLSTCDSIVRSAGGGIELQSEVGAGSSVRIYLPPHTDVSTASRVGDAHSSSNSFEWERHGSSAS